MKWWRNDEKDLGSRSTVRTSGQRVSFSLYVSERQVAFDLGLHSYIPVEKNNIIADRDKYDVQCSALSASSSSFFP